MSKIEEYDQLANSRLYKEYQAWLKRSKNEDVLQTWQSFAAGWMAYARIAAKEWPDCKVSG
jgi:hypothetical protein